MSLKRALATLALLLLAVPAFAGTTADRSPFTQGLWWDPSRSGNGFDIFNVGNDVSVLFYTYDPAGRPIWYSAQGPLSGSSTGALALMEHRWADGKHASATSVGTLRLDVTNPARMTATWTIGATAGSWNLQPFTTSGIRGEVDHTGTWFDPRTAGWGLSFLEQGDVSGGILFTYDAAGLPTWLSGFGRGHLSVEMFAFEGTCPSCAYRAPTSRSAGQLAWEFDEEWKMTLRNRMTAPIAAGATVEDARVFQLGRAASGRSADWQLASFSDGATLRNFLAAAYGNNTTQSVLGFSASPPGVAFSATNLQESGVDEADVVKSDGQYAYTFAHDGGARKPVVRIAQIGADGSSVAVRGSYALASGPATPMQSAGLYLNGALLASVTGAQPMYYFGFASPLWFAPGSWNNGVLNVEVMSLQAPDAPSTRWRAEIEGYLLSSRRIGDRLYVVSRFAPRSGLVTASATLADLLPAVRINGGPPAPLLQPSMVYLPPMGERPPVADMIFVTAIDLANARIAQALAVVGTPEALYASPGNLYLATSRYVLRTTPGGSLLPDPGFTLTDIHQVRLGAAEMAVVASGSVEGFLGGDFDKAAFRLSEHEGKLRAVSSSYAWSGTRNRLTVLESSTASPGLLKTLSILPNAQRTEPLGKASELLYGTRFVGDRLYAVTFLKIDPLYVVDLSNPADPRIAGQVELPGFSDYLHPLPNGLLLGFGKDACPVGTPGDGQFAWYQGLQLALFDVSNANQPRVLQQMVMGKRGSSSALLSSHHAFSALAQPDGSTTIAIPARIHDGTATSTACTSTFYDWKESGLMRFSLAGSGAAARLAALPKLITHTPATTPNAYDPAGDNARSIVFRNATVYIGGGQFWRQDNAGNTSGPF